MPTFYRQREIQESEKKNWFKVAGLGLEPKFPAF